MTSDIKTWVNMSETERNVLKAAHDAGHAIEVFSLLGWHDCRPSWHNKDAYRIAPSAQADTPTLWRDMDDAEKGALLLAAHEGAVVQVMDGASWVSNPVSFHGKFAYRVKPEAPKVETVNVKTLIEKRHMWMLDGVFEEVYNGFDSGPKCLGNFTHTYTITGGRVTACDTVIHGEAE